ncbi:hypothetical protein EDB81DRAFT_833251 [Dactylonectria macrodidyma]|uniref:Uncharacterized protein n=1 Tax=Dactylonectria macrodidyma TaxID=307937 RepID=A0A9P9CZ02_9HYPO|nr:hypothetical protein EDB81DRAFT_833251 [Dactylonectria macrodidyma]
MIGIWVFGSGLGHPTAGWKTPTLSRLDGDKENGQWWRWQILTGNHRDAQPNVVRTGYAFPGAWQKRVVAC